MKSGDRFGTLISPGMGGPARKGSGKARGIKTPSAARGENSKVILRGWLQKQDSGALKLWKKKWCVLADFGLFFYKDEGESNCIGSILLPSYDIKQCKANEVNKKFAFKAEHENMKTFYFAADNQVEMDKWVEALRMASLVQRAPGSGHLPKLIPKSPIMSWDDDVDSPGISPPDMQQYPFSGNHGETSKRRGPDMDSSFQDRQSLQPSLNLQNYGDPYQGQGQQNDYRPGNGFGTFPRNDRGQGQGPRSTNGYGPSDPRYPPDRMDRNRGSQRSNLSQGHSVHDDQRSMSSQRSNQYPSNTMPRNMRPNQFDNSVRPNQLDSSMRSVGSQRSQGYNSLPRDSRSQLGPPIEGQDRPYGHSSPRQPPPNQTAMKGKEDNPYMMMTPHSQQRNERKMDPLKHSNRPLPQEPPPEPLKEKGRSGGGDYASLTRIREKWPNQQLSDRPGVEAPIDREEDQPVLSPTQQRRPDLYVDVPHTYVNVYDESQVRNRDQPPELPSRPPLPVEMRPKLVEDIASSRSPNTQKEMLMAERNLETRMQQPSFFNYPTPTRESLPAFPQNQDSPRSQYSQRSQRSNEQRSQQPSLPQRPDLGGVSSLPENQGHYNVNDPYIKPQHSHMYDHKDSAMLSGHLDGSDATLTNEDERNDKISEFYGLGKYNPKNADNRKDKNRFMSDMDVRANTLPSQPISGVTGEKDFRLRSLPDHVQSMPALYHEQQPLSIVVSDRNQVINSYMNLTPNTSHVSEDPSMSRSDENTERKSAFRRLSSSGSNSLQRIPSGDMGSMSSGYPSLGHSGDYSKSQRYPDQEYIQPQKAMPASSQMSQNKYPWKQDTQQRKPNGPVAPGFTGGQGQKGKRSAAPIQTVKEEPDMPDSQVLQTDLPKRNFLLDGPRLRMSISATDLLGKTHDELVLLLIQLRRDKADLTEQRDSIRKINEQNRPAEFYYRKMLEEGRAMDGEKEAQHRQYQDTKHKLEDVEKKLEVYKPLVNLVCNMVTMGSLYGGDNFMLATEYRKHLLSPEQYSPPKKMLEFSRRNQEEQIVKGIEEDVRHLTEEQADLESKELEEKLERLYSLDRVMQDQSFQVTSLKEDREMLEKALGGLLKKQDQHCTNPRELDVLIQQQKTIERELSRVLQQLAEASKELEETTAENNKLEHEVALLRSKVHGNVSRSKSAPALSSESLRTKMKMEKDLARVKNIMAGLSQEGARLQEMISTLKKPRPGEPGIASSQGQDQQDSGRQQGREGSTYFETDLDSGESKDLGQVTALLASFPRAGQSPGISSPPSSVEQGTSAFRTVSPSSRDVERTFHASPVQASPVHASPVRASPVQATIQAATQQQLETNVEMDGSPNQWDIGDADDNTKRFFGLIPKNLPKQQTVRDVKRNAEARKKKEDDPPPLRVGVIPSDYSDSVNHVYENLPQQKTAPADDTEEKKPWAPSVNTDVANPSGTQRRRSNLHLMTPKPFSLNSKPTPFTSVYTSFSTASQILPQTDAPLLNHNTQLSQSQPSFETMNFEKSQSNATYKPTEPIKMQHTNKTPPPPPVRDSSRYRTSEVNPQSFQDLFAKSPTNRNFDPPVPSILKKGKNNRALNKGRYMTISSSEPVKLEKSSPQSPKLHSQAGDLISSMDVPDIVKSSRARDEQIDERTIEREILYFPEKVTIPERYMPDSDDESVTEDEKAARREKADKIKRILTQQSVHSLSQPDVSKVAGEVHERVEREKEKRALLLGINQELAEQVKRKSLQYAAERRKTWSGSTNKQDMNTSEHLAESDTEKQGDDNNNSFLSPNPKHTRSPLDPKNSTPNSNSYLSTNNISYTSPINSYYDKSSPRKDENSYADSYGNENLSGHYNGNEYSREDNPYNNQYSGEGVEEYSRGDNSDRYEGGGQSSGYSHNMFTSTSYADRPNFKI
ncbi:uncharacterized protein LOC128230418 isoform X3 [Mya arenaria]|nr:uncharacterized protein LOC128230418 isoform X3 [Mya arenaria]